jgi:hypothetical protein
VQTDIYKAYEEIIKKEDLSEARKLSRDLENAV